MSNQPKKQSFLGGAAILAASVAVVKLIGAVYKIPLGNIIGDVGKAHFTVAYNIYNLLLAIATAGLPVAISKLTSEAEALGKENEKRKIFSTSIWLFFAMGMVGTMLMFFGAKPLAAFMNNELACWSIRALSPSVFCVCILACMRGYTQGQGNMDPSAISQVVEAVCKLVIGLPLAWYLLQIGRGVEFSAAGAILGVTLGTVVSMCYMMLYLLRRRTPSESLDVPPGRRRLMHKILMIGVPITLANSAMSIITLIDNKIVLGRLNGIREFLSDTPAALYGQYTFGMDLINLPLAFVFPVTMSLLPFATAAMTQQDHAKANQIISSAFRLIAVLALPAGIGLSVLSGPILMMLYPAQPDAALAAGPHLRVLGIACIFICIMTLTNAILQAYGQERIPIWTMVAGGLTKIVLNYVLVGNPEINIHGAPISTLCCYGVIVSLNLIFVWKYSPEKPRYLKLFTKPAVASLLMGAAVWSAYGFVSRAMAGHSAYGANAIGAMAGILVGVAVYAVLVIALRILRAEDVRSIPHGERLIQILHLK